MSLVASDLNIPGLYLWHDFVNAKEERVRVSTFYSDTFQLVCYFVTLRFLKELFFFIQELLAAVDDRPWNNLSKRRVQHYGYEFCYDVIILLIMEGAPATF